MTGSLVPTGLPGSLGKTTQEMAQVPFSVSRQLQISAVTLKNLKVMVKLSWKKNC